jgi:hypothetical protein
MVMVGLVIVVGSVAGGPEAVASPYAFDGSMPREVLERYLARSITMMDLLTGKGNEDDNVRMLKNMGAKFAGRTVYCWGGERHLGAKLEAARRIAPKVHGADSDIILQAGIFEIVSTDVNGIAVPDWAFEAYGLPVEERTFRYDAMLFPDGRYVNHWREGASVPDMTQPETKLWFYYLARRYTEVGCEGIHFGQVALIGKTDEGHAHWWDMLSRVRAYAKEHARRHFIVCDAHTPRGGPRYEGDRLLFDFHSFPLRIVGVEDEGEEGSGEKPQRGVLQMGYVDSIFGRSNGGVTPSGWRCEHLPFLVELDNFGRSDREGENTGGGWIWGYDEIGWFARQPEAYRNEWLRYAWDWVREHDPNGFLQMPGSRCVAAPVETEDGRELTWYFANTRSEAAPGGFGQEETIRAIWGEVGD